MASSRKPRAAVDAVLIEPSAARELDAIPERFKRQILLRIAALKFDPHPRGSVKLQGEFDKNGSPLYRERSGNYRIVYVVRATAVHVLKVDDRKDVYR